MDDTKWKQKDIKTPDVVDKKEYYKAKVKEMIK
jgi:hypothetical protein